VDHPFSASPTETTDADYARLIEDLAVRHRHKDALRRLMAAGMLATPALRRGLRHADPDVRVGCCIVLDHFMDAACLPDVIVNLAQRYYINTTEQPVGETWGLGGVNRGRSETQLRFTWQF
jgi:hypothetical protein